MSCVSDVLQGCYEEVTRKLLPRGISASPQLTVFGLGLSLPCCTILNVFEAAPLQTHSVGDNTENMQPRQVF